MPSRVHNDRNVACFAPGIASFGTQSLHRDSGLMRSKMWDAPVVIFTQARMMLAHHPQELKFHEPSERHFSWICITLPSTLLEVSGSRGTFSQECTLPSSCRRVSAWPGAPPSCQHSRLKRFGVLGRLWSRLRWRRRWNRTDHCFLPDWKVFFRVCLTVCAHISCLFHWNWRLRPWKCFLSTTGSGQKSKIRVTLDRWPHAYVKISMGCF